MGRKTKASARPTPGAPKPTPGPVIVHPVVAAEVLALGGERRRLQVLSETEVIVTNYAR